MLNKVIGQVLMTASNLIDLEAARCENKIGKVVLDGGANLTKFLAFSDLGCFGIEGNKDAQYNFDHKSISFIGALGLTAAVALDDIAINSGLYKDHHLGKVGSALYAGYRLSKNQEVDGLAGKIIENTLTKIGLISTALLGSSYLFGSGDMINIMRSNTNDCVEFAKEVSDLSGGSVNIYRDMRIAAGVDGVIGGGRQFLGDFKLDIGGPLNGAINTTINTAVNVGLSRNSEKDFKNSLLERFQSKLNVLSPDKISKLDSRSQKILEKLPEYIEKASSSITKNSTNTVLQKAYQQILASSKLKTDNSKSLVHYDMGLSVFIASNLFNTAKIKKNLKQAEIGYGFNDEAHIDKIGFVKQKLNNLKYQKSESVIDTILCCGKKVCNMVAPVVMNSILVGMMHNKDATWNNPIHYKDCYMPVGSIVGVGQTPIDLAVFTAVQELQYLSYELDTLLIISV